MADNAALGKGFLADLKGRETQWLAVAALAVVGLLIAISLRNAVLPMPALVPVIVLAGVGFATKWIWPAIAVVAWTTLLELRLEGHPLGVFPNFADAGPYDLAVALCALAYLAAFLRFVTRHELADPALRVAAGMPVLLDDTPPIDWIGWAASVVAWPVLATMAWSLLPVDPQTMSYLQLTPDVMLLLAATWLLGGGALAIRAVLAAVDAHTMTPAEAKACLNDLLYCEMRPDLLRMAAARSRNGER